MAKTIRSHPTSPFVLPEPIFWTTLKMWTQNGPTFSSFPDLPTTKKTGPQRKKDAHGPSLHIRFLSKCDFLYCIYYDLFAFWGKTHFLKLVSYFNHFVYLRFKYRRPHIIIIIIISKQNSYFKMRTCVCGAFLARFLFCCFCTCPGSRKGNMLSLRDHFLKI